MSHQTSQKVTTKTYRTLNVASPETVMQTGPVSPLPYSVNGLGVRYLVPMQQGIPQQSYVLMQQPMMQQPVMQQVMSPVYLQSMPHMSVSSQESDLLYERRNTMESPSGNSSVVFSYMSSPIKSPEPSAEEEEEEETVVKNQYLSPCNQEKEEEEEEEETVEVEEVEIVNVIQQKPPPMIEKLSRTQVKTELKEFPQPTKLDTRYFGELLAEVYRKNCDIHSCISEHVSKIRGQKHQLDPSNDHRVETDKVEALIPKGATELTKQQIRYLLQTRLTADKSMRLLLSTFSSLREELLHMSEDLRRLEGEKESLERDLSFKAEQARQYDSLLETVRENNRQLQLSLKEASTAQRSLESQLMNIQDTDSGRMFKMKELEGRIKALEKENDLLRQKLAGQDSSTTFHIKTEELSRQYTDQLSSLRREKDEELKRLRSQVARMQTEVTTEKSSSEKSLQLRISELITMLEQRQTTITRQEEEIKRLMQERNDTSKNVTKTIITKRYRNQYPMLGLLSDDYQVTSPVKEAKTIVIERTGEMIKQLTWPQKKKKLSLCTGNGHDCPGSQTGLDGKKPID
ncbi:Protein POF1B Premature ovarian failure protein 1B [Channa argus]|uniref:Protein POF1B Premature ovarian failure protein 1B n=1 Tax=Channa argus TaxID=215402 RepID=A0A6G1QTJ6_CHAAH|nr:Protein POF1B Premature ovarian failure protein 1B [Channa argus]